ncbi:hypothetical protein [Microbulbifer discodermiae]|uniref:hypothetical protein n=1 Tax=Microbulbifer sp. 2201CG32-9 TaxID=3232309 RepID=UPI00345B502E
MTFAAMVILVMFIFAWIESRNLLWRSLASNYSTKGKHHGWRKVETLSIWSDDGSRSWFNHVYIEILEEGVGIFSPFYKRYLPSLLIPWADIEVGAKLSIRSRWPFSLGALSKQELYISSKGIYLAIFYSHRAAIERVVKQIQ